MGFSYDRFTEAFLEKINDYDMLTLTDYDLQNSLDGFLKRAVSQFRKNCKYDLFKTANDEKREFEVEIAEDDVDELVDIISEGMVVQWLKPYVNKQEILTNVLNSRDWTTYSPAELLMRVGNAYKEAKNEYIQMVREYSYNHADLGSLHL